MAKCFPQIRKKKAEKMKQFFYIDPNDPEVQRLREQRRLAATTATSTTADSGSRPG